MKHFVKNLWNWPAEGTIPVPDFSGQREEFICPCCNKRIIIAVPPTATDFERVANDYRDYARKIEKRVGEVVADIEAMHGDQNPFTVYFRNEMKSLAEDLRRWIEGWRE